MEKKFRSHPSVLIERLGAFFWAGILILFANIEPEMIKDLRNLNMSNIGTWIPVFIFLGIVLLLFLTNVIAWAKTWYIVDDMTITVKVNTINRTEDTIGIKNISNVNLEQNIFEMIMGTKKVKINTNSRSTAETTDVEIVLKKDKAEELHRHLLSAIDTQNREEMDAGEIESVKKPEEVYDVAFSGMDVVKHCCLNLSILSVLFLVGIIGALIWLFTNSINKTLPEFLDFELVLAFVMVGITSVYSLIKSMIGDFFTYYQFRIRRVDDHLQMSYGLLKKRTYDIPVNTIHSVKMVQPIFCRLFKCAYVEVSNIGMGDDEGESTKILLSVKTDYMYGCLKTLLPEFAERLKTYNPKKQPKKVIWSILEGKLRLALFLGAVVIGFYFGMGTDGKGTVQTVAICIAAGIWLFSLLVNFLELKVAGIHVGKSYVMYTDGAFKKVVNYILYKDIQYMERNQNLVQRWIHTQDVYLHKMGTVLDNDMIFPEFSEDIVEELMKNYLQHCVESRRRKGLQIEPVKTEEQIESMCILAKEIWEQHFTPIIGADQVAYMLDKFQSVEPVTKQIQEQGYMYFRLMHEDKYIGYTGLHKEDGKLFLSKLYIKKAYRKRGYAKLTYNFMKELAKENGCKSIYLTVNRNNDDTIEVYKHLGFATVNEQKADIGNGFYMDDYIMEAEV